MSRVGSVVVVTLVGAMLAGTPALAQDRGRMSMGMGVNAGMMGMAQDSATRAQMQVIHELVVNHERITRTVTNLPDGVRTVTASDDPSVAKLIRDHTLTMVQRVGRGDDPGLPMESAALQAIFRGRDRIRSTIDTTETGVIVVQTSGDSAVAAALQQHAAEVTDLVQRGMTAMHEMMMKTRGAHRARDPRTP